ncbi:MAG TPA: hypothetical protein VN873_02475 [Candidatus Angelobacter sp.]|nr:hypothetical protein [Candidatus Angelobacter sp.]
MNITPTPELVTVTEMARRISVCSLTLKRRIVKADLKPDAVLLEGSSQLQSPLFDASRVSLIKKILYPELP